MALPPRNSRRAITQGDFMVRPPELSGAWGSLVEAGRQLEAVGSEIRQREAAEEGAKAVTRNPDTGDLEVELRGNFFRSDRAYNQAAQAAYLSKVQPDITTRMMKLGQQYRTDPDAFRNAMDGAIQGFTANIDDPELALSVERMAAREGDLVLGNLIAGRAKADLEDARIGLSERLGAKASELFALARAGGVDTPEGALMASEAADIVELQVQQGFMGPEAARATIDGVRKKSMSEAAVGATGRMFTAKGQGAALMLAEEFASDPKNGLSPQERESFRVDARQYVSFLEAANDRVSEAAKAEVKGLIEDGEAAAVAGKNPFEIVSPQRIREAFPVQADAIIASLRFDAETGAALEEFSLASPAKRYGAIASAEPEGKGFAREAGRQQALIKANAQIERQLAEDPAAYVSRAQPLVAMGEALESGDPKKVQAAVSRSLSAQEEMGAARPKVLSKAQANSFVARMEQADPAARADTILAEISNLEQQFGGHFLQVMIELVEAGMPQEAEGLLMVKGSRAANRMGRAVTVGREVLKKAVGETKAVDDAVISGLSDFATTLWPNADGGRMLNSVHAAAKLYAYQGILDGESSTAAAKAAVRDIIRDRYTVRDGYRVPSNVDSRMVKIALRGFRKNLKAGDFIPLGPNASAELLPLQQNGRWATLPDETGLQLMWPAEVGPLPVIGRDGKPITLKWDAMPALASGILPEIFGNPQ